MIKELCTEEKARPESASASIKQKGNNRTTCREREALKLTDKE
jgi:hypothetical protein